MTPANKTKKDKRTPAFFIRPNDGQSLDDLAEAIAEALAPGWIADINEWRATQGLPPLPKE